MFRVSRYDVFGNPELETRNKLPESYSCRHKKREGRSLPFLVDVGFDNYRFEYWNRFLAPF
jgi:hypothetical protein